MEAVAPADLTGACSVTARQWGREVASPVRASLVVVADAGAEHRFELPHRADERVVEAVFRDFADEASGGRVRLEPPQRRADGANAEGLGHLVEGRRGLRASVADEKAGPTIGARSPSGAGNVGRQDALGLRGEELCPARPQAPWCWGKPVPGEHAGDTCLGNSGAELA